MDDHAAPSTLRPWDQAVAIRCLWLVFWGALLCVFDWSYGVPVNGRGWSIDFFSDLVDCLLVGAGVLRLRELGPGMTPETSPGDLRVAGFRG